MITPKRRKYPPNLDPELQDLCDAINCIPGVNTTGSCSGHGVKPLEIYMDVEDPRGIFFLARCVSRRYWKHGHTWKLYICDVSDRTPDATYVLESTSIGEEAYEEASSLVANIIYHMNHKNFIEGFNVDLSKFDVDGDHLGNDWWEVISNYKHPDKSPA
jgi:hypothetical protein